MTVRRYAGMTLGGGLAGTDGAGVRERDGARLRPRRGKDAAFRHVYLVDGSTEDAGPCGAQAENGRVHEGDVHQLLQMRRELWTIMADVSGLLGASQWAAGRSA